MDGELSFDDLASWDDLKVVSSIVSEDEDEVYDPRTTLVQYSYMSIFLSHSCIQRSEATTSGRAGD